MSTGTEISGQKPEELYHHAVELKEKLFQLRLKHRTGGLESTAELPKLRREIARTLTLARARELGIDHSEKAAEPATREAGAATKKTKKVAKKKPATKKAKRPVKASKGKKK